MFEHDVRVRMDLLSASQERFNGSLSRMEIELVRLSASLPDHVVRAVGALFHQEREQLEAQFAAVNERIAGLGEKPSGEDEPSSGLSDFQERLAAMDARFDRLEQRFDALEADIAAIRRHLLGESLPPGEEAEDLSGE